MKLTNQLRDAFVSAVMKDVPMIDYDEQFRKIVVEDNINQLPKKLQAAVKDNDCKHFVKMASYSPGHNSKLSSVSVYSNDRYTASYTPSAAAKVEIDKIIQLNLAQTKARDDLQTKLKAVIYGCSTLKQAQERLPEFEKYLPKDESKPAAYVPAVSGVVADLLKMGWKVPEKVAAPEAPKNTAVVVA